MHIKQQLINMEKLALLLSLLAAMTICSGHAAATAAVRLQLVHTDAGRGLTPRELLQRMALRTKARTARILAEAASLPVTPGAIANGIPDTEYLVHFAIGTPPQPVQLTLDTGSDLIWTQCLPCISCFNQTLPYFDSSLSSTFAGKLPCSSSACQALLPNSAACDTDSSCFYGYGYGDGSLTSGSLVADTFSDTAGSTTTLAALAFGCGSNNTGIFKSNETGIAGFGRGALSLPSQLKVDNFSYCFTNITGTAPSPVLLGLPANLYSSGPSAIQTVTLIQNPARPPLYFLPLQGITVGSTTLPINGSTIIDSGTGMTSLPHDVYTLVVDALVGQVSLTVRNDTSPYLCFTVPPGTTPEFPTLALNFEGATMELPQGNYMFEVEDSGVIATCLAVGDAGNATTITIIGNYQQQNMHVLYDLANNQLSFVPTQCDMV